jgi:uncharacterized membrane protein HdeD (DUF308 family)
MSNAGTASQGLGGAAEALRGKWASITAFGVLLVVLGVAALVFSLVATKATVALTGVLFLIGGAAEVCIGMQTRNWSRFILWVIGGTLYLAVGVICVADPLLASIALTLLLGAALVAAGLVRLCLASTLPAGHPRVLVLVAAAASVLLGLIIINRWPVDGLYALGALLGVDLLLHGVGWVTFGVGLRARS